MWRNQVFKKISFSPKVKEISKSLDLKDPAIVQGMYIFKQPGIGDIALAKKDDDGDDVGREERRSSTTLKF